MGIEFISRPGFETDRQFSKFVDYQLYHGGVIFAIDMILVNKEGVVLCLVDFLGFFGLHVHTLSEYFHVSTFLAELFDFWDVWGEVAPGSAIFTDHFKEGEIEFVL